MNFKDAFVASFNTPHRLMSCSDFENWIEKIDFDAIGDEVERLAKLPVSENGQIQIGDGFEVDGSIAYISVTGLLVPNLGMDLSQYGITGYDVVGDYVEYANANRQTLGVDEIKLKINSGGGYVEGIDELTEVLEASDLPISSLVVGSMMSAAYWIGVTGNSIEALKGTGRVGSIGVRATHIEVSNRLKMMGVNKNSFTSGFWKDAYADHKPLSKRAAKALQKEVDDEALVFFEHVSKYRAEMSVSDVKDLEADTFNIKKALQIGLIDTIRDDKSTNSNAGTGSNAMAEDTPKSDEQTLTADEANAMAKTAVDKALAERDARDQENAKRVALVDKHETKHVDVKNILKGSGFASVSDEDMTALLDALPKGFSQMMDENGGAGVGASPQELSEDDAKVKAAKEAKQKRKADTEAQLKKGKLKI